MGPIALTRQGRLEGASQRGADVFRGIPFARPPRDDLRFLPPEPHPGWSDTRSAASFGPAAPQVGPVNRLVRAMVGAVGSTQSQDCLYLNVWTPSADRKRRPVMVWLHGGAFILGSGSTPLYNGWRLAKRGEVVVVTINYRLGALGFLSWRALCGAAERAPANLGVLDQIAALEWVRDNIENFGGDPENVTLFGESAGGMSVATILGTPRARGLFHKAVLQSGAAHNVSSAAEADRTAEQFAQELGIDSPTPQRLSERPMTEIMRAQAATSAKIGLEYGILAWQPCVDHDLLGDRPLARVDAGLSKGVPMLVGTNREEWKLFMVGDPGGLRLTESGLAGRFERVLSGVNSEGVPFAELAAEAYYRVKGPRGGEPSERWCAFQSDRVFHYPATRVAEGHSEHEPRTYAYLFEWAPLVVGGRVGACHGLELPFVFGNLRAPWMRTWLGLSPSAQRLCDRIQDAWTGFAKHGDPAHDDLPDWPAYSSRNRSTMAFASECTLREDPHARGREFWDPILSQR